jgi:hypothetical protein
MSKKGITSNKHLEISIYSTLEILTNGGFHGTSTTNVINGGFCIATFGCRGVTKCKKGNVTTDLATISHVGFLSTTTSLWKHGFFSVNLTTKTINKSWHLQKVIETLHYLAPKKAPPAQPPCHGPHSAPWSSAQSIASRCLPGQRHAPRRCRWGTWNAAAMGLSD